MVLSSGESILSTSSQGILHEAGKSRICVSIQSLIVTVDPHLRRSEFPAHRRRNRDGPHGVCYHVLPICSPELGRCRTTRQSQQSVKPTLPLLPQHVLPAILQPHNSRCPGLDNDLCTSPKLPKAWCKLDVSSNDNGIGN